MHRRILHSNPISQLLFKTLAIIVLASLSSITFAATEYVPAGADGSGSPEGVEQSPIEEFSIALEEAKNVESFNCRNTPASNVFTVICTIEAVSEMSTVV